MASITRITNSTGTILDRYKMKRTGQPDEVVQLEFYPSDDYVAGTAFAATPINNIITEIENALNEANYFILQIKGMKPTETISERLENITSATSSDTSVATVSYSGNVITYTAVAVGNAKITINYGTSQTKEVPVNVVSA